MAPVDLVGREFGKLLVLAVSHRTKDRVHHWRCRCSCGRERVVSGKNLKRGNTKSCGCVHGVAISDPIEHSQLLALLDYSPETGVFVWRVEGRNHLPGDVAGHNNEANKYFRVGLGRRSYYAHVLAHFYVTGVWATDEVDHRDGDPANCEWKNLRPATRQQNARNVKIASRNTTGYKGVSLYKGKYRATIVGKELGCFADPVSAARAYDAAAREQFGEFARLNFEVS